MRTALLSSRRLAAIALLLLLSAAGCRRQAERELPETQAEETAPSELSVRDMDVVAPEARAEDEQVAVAPPEVAPAERLPGDSPAPRANDRAEAPGGADNFAGYEAWFERYGLDLNDPKMLDADPDGDGYSNRDEFLVDTDPTDPQSHPGFHPAMRMREFTAVEIPLMLESVNGRRGTVVNSETGEEHIVQEGEFIPGTNYRVSRIVHQVESDKFGETSDVSRLVAEDAETEESVVFMRGVSPRSRGTHAVVTSLQNPDLAVTVRQSEEFMWPGPDGEQRFLVVDLRPEQMVVKQMDTGEVWTVPAERPNP